MSVETPPQTSTSQRSAADVQAFKLQRRQARRLSIFDPQMVRQAAVRSFAMLDPRSMMRNPVMFLVDDRTVIGSELIAQPFASDRYFQLRPSAVDYKADAAGGSNLGTKNPDLHKKIVARVEALKATPERPAPVDLVTASGSGLDPDISPEAAEYQVGRVAAARQIPEAQVRKLLARAIDRSGAIIGAPPRVNVLKLNLALDGAHTSEGTPEHR
jgi:K+-transporting ATPase ATPase C chain